MYIVDGEDEQEINAQCCLCQNPDTHAELMLEIDNILCEVNLYVGTYQSAHQILFTAQQANQCDPTCCIVVRQNTDPQRYNALTNNEVAAIMIGDSEHANLGHDLILTLRPQEYQYH